MLREAYKLPPVTSESVLVTITDKKSVRNGKVSGYHRFYFDDGTYISVGSGTYDAYDIGDIMEVTQYYQGEKIIKIDN